MHFVFAGISSRVTIKRAKLKLENPVAKSTNQCLSNDTANVLNIKHDNHFFPKVLGNVATGTRERRFTIDFIKGNRLSFMIPEFI